MSIALCALIVEDSEDDAILIARHLRRGDYDLTVERVDTPEAMQVALERQDWDVVIADYSMPRERSLGPSYMIGHYRGTTHPLLEGGAA